MADPSLSLPSRPDRLRGAPAPRYDPAFAEAVAAGSLTPLQAFARGRREAFAQRLCERHGLVRDAAYAVADNRTSLSQALREKTGRRAAAERPRGLRLPPAWTLLVALPLGLVAFLAIQPDAVGSRAGRSMTQGPATVVADATGQVLRVTGPSPRSVLRAYCEADGATQTVKGVSLIPAAVREGRARLGLLHRPAEPGNLLTILIEEDPAGGRWFVGDGMTSIQPQPAPPGVYRRVGSKTAVQVSPARHEGQGHLAQNQRPVDDFRR